MGPLAAVALSAAAYAALFPPFEAVALSWIALVPLLLVVGRGGAARGALAGGAFALAMTAAIVAWLAPTLAGYFERPPATTAAVFAAICLGSTTPYYAAAFGLLGWTRGRLPRSAWLLLVPAAWVAAEYGRTELGLRSSWTLLGDAHWESMQLRQIADVTAVYGVSAVVAFANAVGAEWLATAAARWRGQDAPLPLAASAVLCAVLATALGYGALRLAPGAHEAGAREVVVVQGNVAPALRWSRVHATEVLRRYGRPTREALAADANGAGSAPWLVVWPENALQTAPTDAIHGAALRRFVAALGVPLLVGAPRQESRDGRTRSFNAAHLVHPDGALAHYDKRRLLPFSETTALPSWSGSRGELDTNAYAAGSEPGLLEVGGVRVGVLICFEAIYPSLARELARGGAEVLVNLSNDAWFRGDGGARQHLQQTVFRAIETGLPLVRSTSTGTSAIVAPTGVLHAAAPPDEAAVLRASVPARRTAPTLHVRFGDAFAQLCVAACVGALYAAGARGGRATRRCVGRSG